MAIVMLLVPGASFAAAQTEVSVVTSLLDKLYTPLNAFATSLAPSGVRLLVALMTIHVAVAGIQLASGTTDLFELMLKGMKLSLIGSCAFAAIQPQPFLGMMTGIGGSITVPTAIMTGMYKLMQVASTAGTSSAAAGSNWIHLGSLQANGGAAGTAMFSAIFDGIFSTLDKLINIPIFGDDATVWEKIWSTINGSALASLIYWAGSIFMFLLACGVLVMELIGADLTIKFAIAFTPLMVPWILFRPMEFLFNAWLKSIIIGSLAFVVGILMLSGFSAFAVEAANLIQAQAASASTYGGYKMAMTFLPVFLGSFIFFLLTPKAMNIAQGLISGSGTDGISIHAFRMAASAASAVSTAPNQARKEIAGRAANAVNTGKSIAQNAGGAVAGGVRAASAIGAAATSAGSQAYKAAPGGVAAKSVAMARAGLGGARRAAAGAAISGSKQLAGKVGSAFSAKSPGEQAVAGVAAKQGLKLSPEQYNSAASHANQVYADSRALGVGKEVSMGAANRAAKSSLDAIPKPPAQPPAQPPSGGGGGGAGDVSSTASNSPKAANGFPTAEQLPEPPPAWKNPPSQ
jgi:hypothetical protein